MYESNRSLLMKNPCLIWNFQTYSIYRAIWTHGGPTSAFIHIIIALCLLIPRLLIESKLIENGNLPRGKLYQSGNVFT